MIIAAVSLRLIGDLMQPVNQQINVGFNPTVFSPCSRDVACLNDIIQSLAVAASQQARRGVSGRCRELIAITGWVCHVSDQMTGESSVMRG